MPQTKYGLLLILLLSKIAGAAQDSCSEPVLPGAKLALPTFAVGFDVGDLNGDGIEDLVAGSSSTTLQVLLGVGDSTFGAATLEEAAASYQFQVVLAHMDGDAHLDAVVSGDNYSTSLSVAYGAGDGTFSQVDVLSFDFLREVVIEDFDADGDRDIVLNTYSPQEDLFYIENNGDRTFQPKTLIGAGLRMTSGVAADFVENGHLDLAVLDGTGITLLVGAGDGTFSFLPEFAFGGAAVDMAAADLNVDGSEDLVVAVQNQGLVRVLLGQGDGSFVSSTPLSAPSVITVDTADVNADGLIDVVAAHFRVVGGVSISYGRGDGTFSSVDWIPTKRDPMHAAAHDLDGDGRPEVILRAKSELVVYQNGPSSFGTSLLAGDVQSARVADMNMDGHADVVTLGDAVRVHLGAGDGAFSAPVNTLGVLAFGPNAIGDWNADGRLDLALWSALPAELWVYSGNGDGSFAAPWTDPTPGLGAAGLMAGDLDGDGVADLVLSHSSLDVLTVHLGLGDGTFAPPVMTSTINIPREIRLADLDRDGALDVLVAGSSAFAVHMGTGAGGFAAPAVVPGAQVERFELADWNQDGDVDLAACKPGDDVEVRLGNGDGTFGPVASTLVVDNPWQARSSDWNSDGLLDVLVTRVVHNDAALFLGRGDGTFDVGPIHVTGGKSLEFEDFDEDGQLDLVAREIFSGSGVWVLAGGCPSTGSPTSYCTAKTSSAGCVAQVVASSAVQPQSGAFDFFINATAVQGLRNGLLFGGLNGAASIPFNGGVLCVNPPTKRGPIQNSGGSGPTACDGSFATLVNDGQVLPQGLDAGPGISGWYQYWFRDPQNGAGALGTSLSNAVRLDFR